jgi:hypothetical protein
MIFSMFKSEINMIIEYHFLFYIYRFLKNVSYFVINLNYLSLKIDQKIIL